MTIEGGDVFEFPMTQVALDGLLLKLRIDARMVNDCCGDLRRLNIVSWRCWLWQALLELSLKRQRKWKIQLKWWWTENVAKKKRKKIIFQLLSLIRLQQIIRSFSLFNLTSFTSISLQRCFKRKMKDWVWSGISSKWSCTKSSDLVENNVLLQIVKIHSSNCKKRFKFQFLNIVIFPISYWAWKSSDWHRKLWSDEMQRCNRVFSFFLLTVACESICKITFKIPPHLAVHKSLKCKFFHSN